MDTRCCQTDEVIDTTGLVDLIEEIRLRTWARQHYTHQGNRDRGWHPIVLDEMARKDLEAV